MLSEWRKSEYLFEESSRYIPGGVNSPVRAFKNVGGNPLFIIRGKGSKVYDADDREYIDYVASWGPLILGHAHPVVVKAINGAVKNGTSFGAPTENETVLARMITEMVPSIEKVRMVNSGTEATMSAIRLARGYTGRDHIIKFAGCYHGHADGLLVKTGSGAMTFGIPDSGGVPADCAKHTIVLPYNGTDAVKKCMEKIGQEVAAIIVEPIAGNMGLVLPEREFLPTLRELSTQYGVVLIFDEVISGFRVAPGGAQELYEISPDLTCLGKIIGGGMPVGAYGGRKEIMDKVSPLGPVYQAGTLSGNPVAVAAGIAVLGELKKPDTYVKLERKGKMLANALARAAKKNGITARVNQVGSLFSIFFGVKQVSNLDEVMRTHTEMYRKYFWEMLKRSVYLAPSPFETGFVSLAHTRKDLHRTIQAAEEVFSFLV